MMYYNFTDKDFAGCQPSCTLGDMSPRLLDALQYARALCSFPFKINSAYRSRTWELEHGRQGTSSHCLGLAVDIACTDDKQRFVLIHSLVHAGFTRLGIHPTFIHADLDLSKPASVWLYD